MKKEDSNLNFAGKVTQNQTSSILNENGLHIREDFISDNKEEFYKFADYRKMIGTYILPFFIISLSAVILYIVIAAIVVVPLTLPYWVAFIVALFVVVGGCTLVGKLINKKRKQTYLRDLVDF